MTKAKTVPERVQVEVLLRQLWPYQLAIRDNPAKRKVIKAGRRSGKTTVAAIMSIEAFLAGKRVLYAVPTADQLGTWWFEICRAMEGPLAAGVFRKNETEHIIEEQWTKRRIKGKTAWDPDTLRGDYADLLILDEWQSFDEDAWGVVGAPMLLDHDGDAVFLFTPGSQYAGGLSRAHDPRHASKLYTKALADKTGRWATFKFTSFDNPALSKEALDEISADMSRRSFRQEILAEDDEGSEDALVYRAFNTQTQVVEKYPVPVDWPCYTGHDFGSANPAALFLAQDPGTGYIYVWGEYLPGAGRSTAQHVEEFKRLLGKRNVMRRAGGSHQESEIRQGYGAHGWPIAEPLIRGQPATVGAGIDRVRGIMELNKLFVFRTCSKLLEELADYSFKVDAGGTITDEIRDKARYHLCDCLRYALGDFTPETVRKFQRPILAKYRWVSDFQV